MMFRADYLLEPRLYDVAQEYLLEQKLYDAAKWGRFDEVKTTIRSANSCPEFNINRKKNKGNTSLFIACAWGFKITDYSSSYRHYEVAKFLIKNGADVNIANDKGETPLFIAASWGHHHIVELLILHGADLNALANNRLTPLQIAAYTQRVTSPEYSRYEILGKHHAYWSARCFITKLHQSILYASEYTPLTLEEILNDCRMLRGYSATDPNQDIPMEIMDIIVKYNHYAVVLLLINNNADVNIPDESGLTALEKAERCGHSAMAQLLEKNGAVREVPIKQETSQWTL